jgi:hypothetical protein
VQRSLSVCRSWWKRTSVCPKWVPIARLLTCYMNCLLTYRYNSTHYLSSAVILLCVCPVWRPHTAMCPPATICVSSYVPCDLQGTRSPPPLSGGGGHGLSLSLPPSAPPSVGAPSGTQFVCFITLIMNNCVFLFGSCGVDRDGGRLIEAF